MTLTVATGILLHSLTPSQQEKREVDGSIVFALLVCFIFSTIFGGSPVAVLIGIVLRFTITVSRTRLCFTIAEGIKKLAANLDEESLRKAIKDERAMELCFEYTRRFDLIRLILFHWQESGNNCKTSEY